MFRFRHVAIPILIAGIVPLLLAGCAGGHEGSSPPSENRSPPPRLPPPDRGEGAGQGGPGTPGPVPANLDYEVGVGTCSPSWSMAGPDLSTGIQSNSLTATTGTATKGSRVDGQATSTCAGRHRPRGGLSVKAIADSVESSLRRYVKEPSVVVEVANTTAGRST